MISKVFKRHYNLVIDHPIIFGIIIIIAGVLAYDCFRNHTIIHGVGYFAALYIGMFIVDFLNISFPIESKNFIIKRPANKELLIILACTILGLVFVSVRYFTNWDKLNGLIKLSVVPLVVFAFPIVLAIIYLFFFKYTLPELGVNLNYWYLPIFIIIVFGAITLSIVPQNSNWHLVLEQGFAKMLFMSFITAASSEEFTRMLIQTRIGALANSAAVGWIAAAFIWALMHFPVFATEHEKMGWRAVVMATINLVPLGLLWGYITYRTKSIIPSILLHGTNFWGLQNF